MRIVRDEMARDGFFWVETLSVRGRGPDRQEVPAQDSVTHWWGEIALELRGAGSLFVGSGEVEAPQGTMHLRFARTGAAYLLPGSSLKGAVRCMVELLSPSCLGVVADRGYASPCAGGGPARRLCPACGIFGALGYRGRVSFQDAEISGTPRVVVQAQRSQARAAGPPGATPYSFRKLYARDESPEQREWRDEQERLEVIDDARCNVGIAFRHLRPWELGLLGLGLGIVPDLDFSFKLGGAKNRGRGLISLRFLEGRAAECAPALVAGMAAIGPAQWQAWASAYEAQASGWQLWEDIRLVVKCLQEVYGRGA